MTVGREPSELTVISKTKDLLKYILSVSENSPKKYRFTLTGRLINSVSDALENLILANEEKLAGDSCGGKRKEFQHSALAHFKVTDAFAMSARECGCITPRQYEVMSSMLYDCIRLTAGWIKSDRQRREKQ